MVSPITSNYASYYTPYSNGILPRKDAPKDLYSLEDLIRERRKKQQLEEFDRFMTGVDNEIKDVFKRNNTEDPAQAPQK